MGIFSANVFWGIVIMLAIGIVIWKVGKPISNPDLDKKDKSILLRAGAFIIGGASLDYLGSTYFPQLTALFMLTGTCISLVGIIMYIRVMERLRDGHPTLFP